jgi:hypothetical protein
MKEPKTNAPTNSEKNGNEKNEEFENAVRRIMQMPPEESEKIRSEDSKKKKTGS